ncbi:hypothetical protein KKZ45_00760 [Enterobacter bugandensis]|nr:hypothetical protein [Enterobacter bugandensis]
MTWQKNHIYHPKLIPYRRSRPEYSGQTVNCPEKMIFRHDGILFCTLVLTPDKPSLFRRHAQVKRLADAGRSNPHCHTARLRPTAELLRHDTDAAVSLHQTDGGDVIPAYATAEAVTNGAQVVDVLCRGDDFNPAPFKPPTNLLRQHIHPLAKGRISASADL